MGIYNAISVRPNTTCLLRYTPADNRMGPVCDRSKANLVVNEHNGIMSAKAKKKFKQCSMWLVEMSKRRHFKRYKNKALRKFRVTFVTLTLCGASEHSDTEIKHDCLNQLLVEMRKRWAVTHYVWRAEAQHNGNIHFHLITDKFIPYAELRNTWNRILNKLGYVKKYRDKMSEFHKSGFNVRTDLLNNWSYADQKRAYEVGKKNNWSNPNSVDVRPVHNAKQLSHYLVKYCTKDDNTRAVNGRLWSASYSLARMRTLIIQEDDLPIGCLKLLEKKFEDKIFYGDFFACIFAPFSEIKKYLNSLSWWLYDQFIDYHRTLVSPNCVKA